MGFSPFTLDKNFWAVLVPVQPVLVPVFQLDLVSEFFVPLYVGSFLTHAINPYFLLFGIFAEKKHISV